MIITKYSDSINSLNYVKLTKTSASSTETLNISVDNIVDISKLSKDSPEFMKYKAFLEFGYYDSSTMKPIVIAPDSTNLNTVIKIAIGSEYNKYGSVKLLFYGKHLSGNNFTIASPQPTKSEYQKADVTEYYIRRPTYFRLEKKVKYDEELTYYEFIDGNYKENSAVTQDDLDERGDEFYIENKTYLRLHKGSQYSSNRTYYVFDDNEGRDVYQELSSDETSKWCSPDIDNRYWIGDIAKIDNHPYVYMYNEDRKSYELTDLYSFVDDSLPYKPDLAAFKAQFLSICPWELLGTYYIKIVNNKVELAREDEYDSQDVYKINCNKFMDKYDYFSLSEQFMYAKPNPYDSKETYYIDEDIELLLSVEFERSTSSGADLDRDKLVTVSLAKSINNIVAISRSLHEDELIDEYEHLDQFYSMVPYLDSSDLISSDYLSTIENLPNGVVMNNMLITGSFDKYNLGYTYIPKSTRNDDDVYIEVIDY